MLRARLPQDRLCPQESGVGRRLIGERRGLLHAVLLKIAKKASED